MGPVLPLSHPRVPLTYTHTKASSPVLPRRGAGPTLQVAAVMRGRASLSTLMSPGPALWLDAGVGVGVEGHRMAHEVGAEATLLLSCPHCWLACSQVRGRARRPMCCSSAGQGQLSHCHDPRDQLSCPL